MLIVLSLMIWADRRGSASCVHPDICTEADRHQLLRAARHLQTRIARHGLGTRYWKFSFLPLFLFSLCVALHYRQASRCFRRPLIRDLSVSFQFFIFFYLLRNIYYSLIVIGCVSVHEFFAIAGSNTSVAFPASI